ncbi:hypothetical protein [Paenibacillus sp. YYML68]|uniref:hypothetical protein n=1 Tax=Paenibacillus sp. YYML68 TaxID=2909250 RepID=UPI00248F4BB5|nr:hypothetical protein [Paenibacillus sp. YYML68]
MKTQDTINQQAACSNANLFLSNLILEQQEKITNKRTIGALISAYDQIGVLDALEVTALVEQFESQLNEISLTDAENIYRERWEQPGLYKKVVSGKVDRKRPSFLRDREY